MQKIGYLQTGHFLKEKINKIYHRNPTTNLKISISIFLLFLPVFSLLSQRIEPGKYIYEYGDNVKVSLEVLEDSTFYITEYSWNNFRFGYGNFKINKNKITLTFCDIPTEKKISLELPEYKILSFGKTKKDNISIDLTVYENLKNEPLEGVYINVTDTNNFIITNKIRTNDSGFVKIKIKKRFLPLTVKVFFVGYDHALIPINEPNNYTMEVILKEPINEYYERDIVKIYNIQFTENDIFKLENLYEFDDWFTFKKEDKWKQLQKYTTQIAK